MSGLFAALPVLFAQAPAAGGGANQGLGSYLIFIYIGIALLWFYLFLILPPQQQEKKRKAMLSAMKKNDRVITTAGIYGTVVGIDEERDRVLLRIDEDKGGKVAFTKGSIARVLESTQDKDKATETA
jgi:preprotein translocase subunit YajC